MLSRKKPVFAPTDGSLSVCERGEAWTERGLDWTGPDGLDPRYELAFESMQVRSDDVAWAGQEGSTVTAKVRVRRAPGLTVGDTVLMDGSAYDVARADADGRLCYLYLEQMTAEGTVELVSRRVETDFYGESHAVEERTEVLCRACEPGTDSGDPTLTVTLRACDYAGERTLVRGGDSYTVNKAVGDGDWTRLTCREGVVDR